MLRQAASGLLTELATAAGCAAASCKLPAAVLCCVQPHHPCCALLGQPRGGAVAALSTTSASCAAAAPEGPSSRGGGGSGSAGPSSSGPGSSRGESRYDSAKRASVVTSAATAAAASASQRASQTLSSVTRPGMSLAEVPRVPAFLGFTGAIPFLVLSPVLLEPLVGPGSALLAHATAVQLSYGAAIVSFLGAVHWGAAMTGSLSGPSAMLTERYVWSVVPCLLAVLVPALDMPQGPASVAMATILFLCYMTDRSYMTMGLLPSWYLALRTYLTLLAVTGLCSTGLYHWNKDVAKAADKIKEQEETARANRKPRPPIGEEA